MEKGLIQITPPPTHVGPNSVDLRFGPHLKQYNPEDSRWVRVQDPLTGVEISAIDPRNPPGLVEVPTLPDGGWVLIPGRFYLGETLERTYCRGVVPRLDGRSTSGRLSIEVHRTAGVGDNGFDGVWTLEITVTVPVIVRPGDRLLQVYFEPALGVDTATGILQDSLTEGLSQYETRDLYVSGRGHHYQQSSSVGGPAPLD
jgi:dCTP deaminase